MTIYESIINLSTADLSGILSCCGYALREESSLFRAVLELGFEIPELEETKDVLCDQELCHLAMFCTSQLLLRTANPLSRGTYHE